ncbi:hypothetical protein KCU66_g78, partial [Aureobasidium melanogenum]
MRCQKSYSLDSSRRLACRRSVCSRQSCSRCSLDGNSADDSVVVSRLANQRRWHVGKEFEESCRHCHAEHIALVRCGHKPYRSVGFRRRRIRKGQLL